MLSFISTCHWKQIQRKSVNKKSTIDHSSHYNQDKRIIQEIFEIKDREMRLQFDKMKNEITSLTHKIKKSTTKSISINTAKTC